MRDEAAHRRLVTALLAAAIFAAPFLALLVRLEAGLAVMAVGLTSVALLLREALQDTPTGLRQRLRLLVGINVALAVACLLALAWTALGR